MAAQTGNEERKTIVRYVDVIDVVGLFLDKHDDFSSFSQWSYRNCEIIIRSRRNESINQAGAN